MLIHLCILGVVYACALLPCARSIFELVPQAVLVGTKWDASLPD